LDRLLSEAPVILGFAFESVVLAAVARDYHVFKLSDAHGGKAFGLPAEYEFDV